MSRTTSLTGGTFPGIALLGPPAVFDGDGVLHEIRGQRPAALLAVLVANHGAHMSAGAVRDEVWGEGERSDGLLRVTLNRLRAQLSVGGLADAITHDRLGLRLDAAADLLDTWALEQSVCRVAELRSAARPDAVVSLVAQTELLWRGHPYEGVDEAPSVVTDATRLLRLRADLRRAGAVALVRLGDYRRATTVLGDVIRDDPHHEFSGALLAAVHYADGRQRDANRIFASLHRDFAEAGLLVGPDGRRVEQLIVDGSPVQVVLAAALGDQLPPLEVGRPSQRTPWPLIGRRELLDDLATDLRDHRAVRIVEGDGGAGKTRLAFEVADRLVTAGLPVIWCRCDRADVALAPLPDLLRAAESLCPGLDGELPQGAGESGGPPLEASAVQARLQERIERVLGALPVGTTVVVDDVHRVGEDGAAWLRRLVDRTDHVGWLLLSRTTDRTDAADHLVADLARSGHHVAALGPLQPDEVQQLARLVDPSMGRDAGETIARRAGGNPFLAIVLTRHVSHGGDPSATPSTIHSALGSTLQGLGSSALRVAEVLAVDGGLGPATLRRLLDADGMGERYQEAIDELQKRGIVRLGPSRRPELVHDLWADVVLAGLDEHATACLHGAVAGAVRADQADPERVLRHLLAAGALAEDSDLDRVATDALGALSARGGLLEAANLARSYVSRRGVQATRREHVAALLQAAIALLGSGESGTGMAVLEAIEPVLARLDDPELAADMILARGAVDVGSRPEPLVLDCLGKLIDRLPGDVKRTVQLHCWAAHLRLNGADVEGAAIELDRADEVLVGAEGADPFLRGLVLGIRHQAELHFSADPSRATVSYERLARYAAVTSEPSSDAMASMFRIERAFRHGEVDGVRQAVRDLEELHEVFSRPDVGWWILAARSAVDLAVGDLERAEPRIAEAGAQGDADHLPFSRHVLLTHHLLLNLERGTLADVIPPATPSQAADMPRSVAALAGLRAVIVDGNCDQAREIAAQLAHADRLLEGEGIAWPALAFLAGELAGACGSAELATTLNEKLERYRGIGLSVAGLAYFGLADRVLATCARVLGDVAAADELAAGAARRERERGFHTWIERASPVGAQA